MKIKIEKDFNLDHIFDCGQCFRWEREDDGSYTGIAFGKVANLRYDGGQLLITGPGAGDEDEAFWRDYLDLGTDYSAIKARLSKDEKMRDAIDFGYGIRILNQDPWETFVSFIISQNNNIPRIKGCIEKLCELFGQSLGVYKGKERFSFPDINTLAALGAGDLAPVRLGYRAPYIVESAEKAGREGLPTKANLLDFKGVGPKVANCIRLFALRDTESFPIDTWMVKIMHYLYGFEEGDKKGMAKFAEENFGKLGGYAQQYLFYYARSLEELKK